MSKLGAVSVTGKSGAVYKFIAYSLDTTFRRHRPAVVLITRRRQLGENGPFKHRRVAVDQTDDLRQLLAEHPKFANSRTANSICVHAEADKSARAIICKDLRG